MRPFALLLLMVFSACSIDMGIGRATNPPPNATIVDLLIATTRNRTEAPTDFGVDRAAEPSFVSYKISIPPNHQPGQIEWPETPDPDPRKNFATLQSQDFGNQQSLMTHLNTRLAKQPDQNRGVFLFVHGYNYSFAESVYASAQLHADYENPLIPLHFSWASGGRPGLYAYDQDSALVARDDLAELLSGLVHSNTKSIEIVAHSMGAFVLMEALRLLPEDDLQRLRARMGGITLLSPDLDADVFASQITKIAPLPQPFYLLTSQKDFILQISELVRGGSRRAGLRPEDYAELEQLGVTPLDLTVFANGENFNHTMFNNPDLISFVVDLAQNRRGRRINLAALEKARLRVR